MFESLQKHCVKSTLDGLRLANVVLGAYDKTTRSVPLLKRGDFLRQGFFTRKPTRGYPTLVYALVGELAHPSGLEPEV